jgi:S-DNA-T family DNA segregation ATPase FtsK/SpoIIIE
MLVPLITHVVLGPPMVLTVRLQPGMTVDDVRALAPKIAPHVGAYGLRVEPRGSGDWAVVTLLTGDPLADEVHLTYRLDGRVMLGRLDTGADLAVDLRREAHMIVQGGTRSGKSGFTYSLLAQAARQPDVRIAGCDPTGLLWRPFAGSAHSRWQVSGLRSVDAHEALLTRLVDEMDQRITDLPEHRDTVSADVPLVLVVLEELAGLYRAADAGSKDQGKRIRALIGRLLAEGAKAGYRLLLIIQRAEAALIGGFERANCSTRLSFRTDNRAGVELLHPGAPADLADAHTTSAPGVALVSTPGLGLARIRAPWIGGYSAYSHAVKAAA